MENIRENYRRLVEIVSESTERSGRKPGSVRLVGVSKRVTVDKVRTAIEAGLREIGENRIQEAEQKFGSLEDLDVTCHLIGRLQSNKAGRALKLFSVIQTVDSSEIAKRLDRLAGETLKVLVQVQLEAEDNKGGARAADLPGLINTVQSLRNLELVGLMTIPPFMEDPERVRPYFARLRVLGDTYGLKELSMGMSHDFRVAIEEGATIIRVGRALFGERE